MFSKITNKLKTMNKFERITLGLWLNVAVFLIVLIAVLVSLGNVATTKNAIKAGDIKWSYTTTVVLNEKNATISQVEDDILKSDDALSKAASENYTISRANSTIEKSAPGYDVTYTLKAVDQTATEKAVKASNGIAAVATVFTIAMFSAIAGTVWVSVAKKRGGKK